MKNNVAIVTGGAGGIGNAICNALASKGYMVICADSSIDQTQDGTPFEDCPAIIRKATDVTSKASIRACVDAAVSLGELTAIVNCAAILRGCSADHFDEDLHRLMLDINVLAMPRMTEAALPHLSAGAAIVNISSISPSLGQAADASLYGASKAALETYTRHLACELGPTGIRVVALAPGFIIVPNHSPDFQSILDDPKSAVHRIPLGRTGTPEEIADMTVFLLSEKASYLTGTTVTVDGGLTAT